MTTIIKFLAVAAALGAGSGAQATTAYGILTATNSPLFSIDSVTGVTTTIGNTGVTTNFGDLANVGTSLYALGGRGNNNLYTLNTTTGAATLIGAHGINDLFGLAYDPNAGVMYATSFISGQVLYSLSLTTGAATVIGTMGAGIGGLTYDTLRNRLVGVNDGGGTFYAINTATAAVTSLGNGGGNDDSDIAYDASTDSFLMGDYQGRFFRYDAATFTRTTVVTGLGRFDGIAILNGAAGGVPEPAAWALMIAGFGMVGSAARRRRTMRTA